MYLSYVQKCSEVSITCDNFTKWICKYDNFTVCHPGSKLQQFSNYKLNYKYVFSSNTYQKLLVEDTSYNHYLLKCSYIALKYMS